MPTIKLAARQRNGAVEVQVTILRGRGRLPPELRKELADEGYQIAEGVTSLNNILHLEARTGSAEMTSEQPGR